MADFKDKLLGRSKLVDDALTGFVNRLNFDPNHVCDFIEVSIGFTQRRDQLYSLLGDQLREMKGCKPLFDKKFLEALDKPLHQDGSLREYTVSDIAKHLVDACDKIKTTTAGYELKDLAKIIHGVLSIENAFLANMAPVFRQELGPKRIINDTRNAVIEPYYAGRGDTRLLTVFEPDRDRSVAIPNVELKDPEIYLTCDGYIVVDRGNQCGHGLVLYDGGSFTFDPNESRIVSVKNGVFITSNGKAFLVKPNGERQEVVTGEPFNKKDYAFGHVLDEVYVVCQDGDNVVIKMLNLTSPGNDLRGTTEGEEIITFENYKICNEGDLLPGYIKVINNTTGEKGYICVESRIIIPEDYLLNNNSWNETPLAGHFIVREIDGLFYQLIDKSSGGLDGHNRFRNWTNSQIETAVFSRLPTGQIVAYNPETREVDMPIDPDSAMIPVPPSFSDIGQVVLHDWDLNEATNSYELHGFQTTKEDGRGRFINITTGGTLADNVHRSKNERFFFTRELNNSVRIMSQVGYDFTAGFGQGRVTVNPIDVFYLPKDTQVLAIFHVPQLRLYYVVELNEHTARVLLTSESEPRFSGDYLRISLAENQHSVVIPVKELVRNKEQYK